MTSTRMLHRRIAGRAALAVAVAVSVAVPSGAAGSVNPAAAAGVPAARAPLTPAAVGASWATLITGDRFAISSNGPGRWLLKGISAARSGPAGAFRTASFGGHAYAIPESATPYLGRQLDRGLFDVAALAAGGAQTRVPLRIAYPPGSTPSLPGVTIVHASDGAATGYATPEGARLFGEALARQFAADAKAGWPGQSTGMFARVTSVAADVAALGGGVTPQYPMVTLIVKVIDTTGAPAPFADVFLMNAEDGRRYASFVLAVNGLARVSLPLGTYTAVTGGFGAGQRPALQVVATDGYQVTGDQQTMRIDLRSATSRLSVRVPRPADRWAENFDLLRVDATGNVGASFGFSILGPGDIDVSPTPPAALGALASVASWSLLGNPLVGDPYTYALGFHSDGIAADQSYTVQQFQLATIKTRLYSQLYPSSGLMIRLPIFGDGFGVGGWYWPVSLPSNRVDYLTGPPGTVWLSSAAPGITPFNPFLSALDDSGPRVVPAGSTRQEEWFRQVQAPGPWVVNNGDSFPLCLDCRAPTAMTLVLIPFGDTTPGHVGELFSSEDGSPVAHLRVFRDGVKIFDQLDTFGTVLQVPRVQSTYRVVQDVDRFSNAAVLATTSRTEATFVSSASSGPDAPTGWTCLGPDFGPAPGRCSVLPLLTASVAAPTNLVGSVQQGRVALDVKVGHNQGAAPSRVTSLTVAARVAGGAWRTLTVTAAGGGRYTAAFTATPAMGGQQVDLRVEASDAAGSTWRQTVTSAFAVATN